MNEHESAGCPHRELAVGWALRCLEPDEEATFAAHLDTCAECLRTVAETEEIGALMGASVAQVDPPPDLGRRILTAAGVGDGFETSEVPMAGDGLAGGGAPAPPAPVNLDERRRSRMVTIGLAAATIVLVAVSVGLGIRVAQLDSDRDDLVAQRNADSALINEVLDGAADPDVARVAIATTDGMPMAVMLGHGPTMTLVPVHLPPNSPDRDHYVLWGLTQGRAQALDTFDVSGDDRSVRTVRLDPQAATFTAFAVSLEPGRTPPASPSKVMASGTVDS